MKGILTKLASQTAVGLYVGNQEVAIIRLAGTFLGPIEVERRRVPYEREEDLPEVLGRLLRSRRAEDAAKVVPVTLGLPLERIFFSTRPIRTDNNTASPQVLLHEALQSTAVLADDMVVDVIKARPEQRKVASIAACRKKYLLPLVAALERSGGRLMRAEPAPCALLRAGMARLAAPRRARTVMRIFLGHGQGLAVAVAANLPLVWRSFCLPDANDCTPRSEQETFEEPTAEKPKLGEEVVALRSVIRSLQSVIVHCGVEPNLDAVLIHGRTDLHQRLEQGLSEELSGRVSLSDGPELGAETVAYGLALGGLRNPGGWSRDENSFDLAHALKPPARFRDLVPWRELVGQALLLLVWVLYLLFRLQSIQHDYQTIHTAAASAQAGLGSASESQLRGERQELTAKVEAVRGFLATRVAWTAHTHEVTERLPSGATLLSLQGSSDLEDSGARKSAGIKGKRGLLLKASAPIASGGSVPREVDGFLTSLRVAPNLQRDFALVELADLRWSQPSKGGAPVATFTVACLPRVDRSKAAAANAAKAKSKDRK